VTFRVTPAFGVHEKLGELILLRAGVTPRPGVAPLLVGAERCWHPSGVLGTCGDACRSEPADTPTSQPARAAATR
jgi:hypothetical protein